MEIVIEDTYVNAEKNNELFEMGFKFKVQGDWRIIEGTDPWSGMPNTTGNTHYFTDRNEAENYAKKQTWVFNDDIHGIVEKVTRKETHAEYEARIAEERKIKNEKRVCKEIENANALGITVEEYRILKKINTTKKRYEKEIAEMENKIAKMKIEITRKKNFLENN